MTNPDQKDRSSRHSTSRQLARRVFTHENAVLLIVLFALIGVMAGVSKGVTARLDNMVNVLLQSSIRGVASVGQAFVILTAGIDISVGGIGLFSAILGALMMATGSHNIIGHPMSPYMVIPIMLLAGLGWGAFNGLIVSRVGIPALIVTLGMWQITQGAGFLIGGGFSIAQQPEALSFFGSGRIGLVPVPVTIFIAIAAVAYFVLHHTTFGRSAYAVGGNPVSAWLSGISVRNIHLAVYSISGLLSGLAGVIMTARIMSASMKTLAGLELDSIAAVCIGGVSLAGGRGTIIGAVIGVIIIGVINNGMSVLGADPAVQGIAKGAIIILAVTVDYIRRRK